MINNLYYNDHKILQICNKFQCLNIPKTIIVDGLALNFCCDQGYKLRLYQLKQTINANKEQYQNDLKKDI